MLIHVCSFHCSECHLSRPSKLRRMYRYQRALGYIVAEYGDYEYAMQPPLTDSVKWQKLLNGGYFIIKNHDSRNYLMVNISGAPTWIPGEMPRNLAPEKFHVSQESWAYPGWSSKKRQDMEKERVTPVQNMRVPGFLGSSPRLLRYHCWYPRNALKSWEYSRGSWLWEIIFAIFRTLKPPEVSINLG